MTAIPAVETMLSWHWTTGAEVIPCFLVGNSRDSILVFGGNTESHKRCWRTHSSSEKTHALKTGTRDKMFQCSLGH